MFEDCKILYLEDEILIALDTSEHLETLGFDSVVMAHRLDQAREAAATTTFDFALLDINVDRGQTSLSLGEDLNRTGVVVIYASGSSEKATDLRADGCLFLDKPLSLTVLTDTLRQLQTDRLTA
ncbi:response regulator [Mesobacterium pallidum]|uniref:response regulator n=1 Tax=Mesobacterium pallidum TaxID=2872037 RepID=UPI001EE2A483|nr:response regulator [Mesobacterium pallidum]